MFKLRPAKETPGGRTEFHWAVINDSAFPSKPLTRSPTCSSSRNVAPDVNAQDDLGRSALHWAAALGNTRWARHLVHDLDADGLRRDRDGKTALHEAATNGYEKIVKTLLENQKVLDNIDAQDNHHRTALHWAADHGREEVVLLLTASGADILTADKSNNTALHRAVRNRREDKVVTRRGVSIMEADPSNTMRHRAAWKRCEDILKYLIDKLGDDGERKALLSAIEGGHLDVAKELCLQHAALQVSVEMKKCSWEPLLWYAAGRGDVDIVELLLQKDVDGKGWGLHVQKPLQLAAEGGHDAVVQRLLLLEHIDVNAAPSGRTALSYAAANGHDTIVRQLLSVENIDPNRASLDVWHLPPLAFAAKNGQTAVVELMLGHRHVIVDAADSEGRTSLIFAAEKGLTAVMELLLEKGGASVDLADHKGRTPISFAADAGHCDVLELLLRHQGEADTADRGGRTPLSYAAEKGQTDAVKLLIEKGAQVNSVGEDTMLTIFGDLVRPEDAVAKTPLQYASENKHADVAELLGRCGALRSLPPGPEQGTHLPKLHGAITRSPMGY
ncbi:ankyrin [Apiospora rasikravindrae]|uniref:Ankyrin n=1 Tax=Apiospora rasikravindrae TaxID=990691 RepID=A0ABR1T2B2_9PEZI